jgi:hypothetical protein
MVHLVAAGVVIGGLMILGLRRRRTRARQREARSLEHLAAVVLYVEMQAAIDSLELALTADGSKWSVSLSQSSTLTEAWRAHGEALVELGAERWGIVSDAVSAVAPSDRPLLVSGQTEVLKRSLAERRELLIKGAGILRSVRDRSSQLR